MLVTFLLVVLKDLTLYAKVCFFIYVYRQIIQNQFTEQQIGKRANLN